MRRLFLRWWHQSDLWYRFKCWAWHRYSTVRPRYLGHTWVDRCELLPHVIFEIISDFVENECSPGHIEWYSENSHKVTVNGKEKFVRDELQDIYNWWHKKMHGSYPALEDELLEKMAMCSSDRELHAIPGNPRLMEWRQEWDDPERESDYKSLSEQYREFEDRVDREKLEYMHRAVNCYRSLWT